MLYELVSDTNTTRTVVVARDACARSTKWDSYCTEVV